MSPKPLASLTLTALLLTGTPTLQLVERTPFNQPAIAQTNPKVEADRLFYQGILQYRRSRFREALQSWEQVLQRYRQLGDGQGEANSLSSLGLAYYSLGDYRKAIEFYQQSLDMARAIGYRQGEVEALNNLGLTYDVLGDYPKAIAFYQNQLALARVIGNRQGEGAALNNQGNTYSKLGNYRKALDFHQQALSIAQEIGDRQGEAVSLSNLGLAYRNLGDYRKALDFHQQALSIAQEIGDRQGEVASLGDLGFAHRNLGDYRQAIDFHQKSLIIAREIGDRQREGVSFGDLGRVYHFLGDYRQAIHFHQQHLTIAREIGDRRGEAASLGDLGLTYDVLGDSLKAIDFHRQSLSIAREIGDRQREGTSLDNLGNTYHFLGDSRQAIDLHQQSLSIAREIGDRQGEGTSLGNLGNAYHSLGNSRKAIDFHQQHLSIAREIGDRQGEVTSLGNLGSAYHSISDYHQAIDFHQKQLTIADEIGNRQEKSKSLGGLGNAHHSLGDALKAIDFHQQHLSIAREIGDRQGEAISLGNLGIAFLGNNQLSDASRALYQSIQLIETLWHALGSNSTHKLSFSEKDAQIYRHLQWVLVLQEHLYQALEIAEQGRTRTLSEQMARPLNDQSVISPTLADIQRLAAEQNATLVEYSILPTYNMLLVWVIHPSARVDFKAVDLSAGDGSLADIAKLSRKSTAKLRGNRPETSALTSLVQNSPPIQAERLTSTRDPLRQLHQLLIRPIADLLPPADSHIIFIPHQELFLVPFAALKDDQEQYLIEKYAISTAPSLTALRLAQQHQKRVQGKAEMALVVGNPDLPKQLPAGVKLLEPLPDAEEEAKAIADRFGTKPLLGAEATETAVVKRLHQARIIHLATHGLALDPPNWFDLSGRIALAPSATDDGWLTATELVELTRDNPLNAEMVVLSACDTGLGRVTGDGILGLSRALIVSGVPSIVVSLWQVPDDSTQFLMERFYEELDDSDNRAQALRKAMLQTMDVHEGPADWAAFTLVGTAR